MHGRRAISAHFYDRLNGGLQFQNPESNADNIPTGDWPRYCAYRTGKQTIVAVTSYCGGEPDGHYMRQHGGKPHAEKLTGINQWLLRSTSNGDG
jgi:hypothetical protein